MDIGISFSVCSSLFNVLLFIVYLSKKKLKNFETQIYLYLLVSVVIGSLTSLPCYYFVLNAEEFPFAAFLFSKLYLVFIHTWTTLISLYFLQITNYTMEKDTYFKRSNLLFTIYYIIILILIIIMPIYYNSIPNKVYTYGPSVNLTFLMGAFTIVLFVYAIFKESRNIKNKKVNYNKSNHKFTPIFLTFIIGTIAITLQKINPSWLFMTTAISIVTHLMYHTIENPDLVLLREIANKKDKAMKINKDKTMFLFNISQDIKKPAMDIDRKCEDTLMSENAEEFKEGIRSIKESNNQILRLINASLNIPELSSANLKLVNKKYNTTLMFKEIIEMTKNKLKNKNISFIHNVDESIPEYLMGDSIRFKQMISILLNNAIKYTNKGYVELEVNYIIKKDICSLIISVNDSGLGMPQEKLDSLLNSSREVTGSNEDIATAKTIAGLLNGTIIGISEEGNGSEFTIVVNQKIITEEENNSVERSILKVDSDKKILIVENNKKEQDKIIKLLKDENINIELTNMGVGCLDKIRNGNQYDVIIIDEELPKLSGIMTYQKLKLINNFNIPVIMLIDKTHEGVLEKYYDLGIKECITMPLKKEDKTKILKIID